MRLIHDRKGQVRIIEAIMAILIVVLAITVVNLYSVTPTSPKYEATELEKLGYNVLHDLDQQQLLARFVLHNGGEWQNLTSALTASLPPDVYFNLTVYDMVGRVMNNQSIAYGINRVFNTAGNVASVTYVVPGYGLAYKPRVLVLQMVRG